MCISILLGPSSPTHQPAPDPMAVALNHSAAAHAASLIHSGHVSNADSWTPPSAEAVQAHIKEHGFAETSRWFLGEHTDHPEGQVGRLAYPFSHDFATVSKPGIRAVITRAAQSGDSDVEKAGHHLYEMMGRHEAHAAATQAFGSFSQVDGRLVIQSSDS